MRTRGLRRLTRTARGAQPRKALWTWLGCAVLVVAVATAGVLVGQVSVPPSAVLRVLETHLMGIPHRSLDPVQEEIVWQVRLPRVLAGMLVGLALAVSGVVIQAVVRNPLGDPYILGVTPGASLGAVAAIVTGSAAGSTTISAARIVRYSWPAPFSGRCSCQLPTSWPAPC